MEFLRKIVDNLLEQQIEWGQTVIVTPNRRAGIFLEKYIHENQDIPKPLWMPRFLTIQDFVSTVSDLTLIDRVTLIFKLYPIYCSIFKNPKAFDAYYQWGQVILSDFNDIDLYLTDREQLFRNLKDLSRIDLEFHTGGTMVDDFIRFSSSLQDLYYALQTQLLGEGYAYYGLALRSIMFRFDPARFSSRWKHIVFAGFNALSTGEQQMIARLAETCGAICYWDIDRALLDDEDQEAGFFLRNNPLLGDRENVHWIADDIGDSPKSIEITGVPGRVAQTKLLGKCLFDSGDAGEGTAVVLADESLLFPVLHAIPDQIRTINVTMGYPLNMTSLYHLIESLIDLFTASDSAVSPDHVRFVLARPVLLHPYILFFAEQPIRALVNEAQTHNHVLIPLVSLVGLDERIGRLFKPVLSVSEFIDRIRQLLRDIVYQFKDESRLSVEIEILFQFYNRMQRLDDIIRDFEIELTLTTFRKLFQDIVTTSSVPFLGEPLQGLQVMGLLETRALDFKRVFILSANEGILPAGQSQNSFIPTEVRHAVGMMTHAHSDAIFAYTFYRLLKQAESVCIYYSTLTDAFGKGERSRYIDQLIHEFKPRFPNLTITHKTVLTESKFSAPEAIGVKKTRDILRGLESMTFSPTRLQTYVACSLRFYFRYILKLNETEEVVESADARIFGSVIHKVLERLYRETLNEPLTEEKIENQRQQMQDVIESIYLEEMGQVDIRKGRNFLNCRIIEALIGTYLKHETPGKQILSTEQAYQKRLEVGNSVLLLQGTVDRVEREGNVVNIIDFKTGLLKSLSFDLSESHSRTGLLEIFSRKPQVLQLLFYGFLVADGSPFQSCLFRLGIYSFKEQKTEGRVRYLSENNGQPVLFSAQQAQTSIATILREVFLDLLDVCRPFAQTEDLRQCAICPYVDVCGR